MEVIKTDIDGVLVIEPRLFRDARGYFFESFSEREFKEKVEPLVGYKVEFCQDNESMSSYGVMRGLHFQRPPFTQSKLVRCVKGRVLDVAVDIRKGSPTYGKHVAVELTEDNHRQFFIPKGFAHGFAVLSETAVFQYKCDNFYHPEADGGISILDESLGIDWRIPTEHANLSEKDMLIAQELSSYYKLPLEEVLMPTFRPPVKPISMGALADAWEETVRDGDEGSYGSYDLSATKGGGCE